VTMVGQICWSEYGERSDLNWGSAQGRPTWHCCVIACQALNQDRGGGGNGHFGKEQTTVSDKNRTWQMVVRGIKGGGVSVVGGSWIGNGSKSRKSDKRNGMSGGNRRPGGAWV